MILNNTEKFYSMIAGILLPKVIMMLSPYLTYGLQGISFPSLILLYCLLGMLICSVSFFKERTFIPNIPNNPFPKQA